MRSDALKSLGMDPLARSVTDEQFLKLLAVWELLRTRHREIPAQAVTVLLYVASHNPCHMQAIENDLRLSPNSVSRNTDWLSKYHRLGKPGMGLVVKIADPVNARRRLVKLTEKGHRLVERINQILESP